MKRIYFIIIAIIAVIYVISIVRKNKFSIKESFYWFVASIIMLILAIFPKLLDSVAIFIGVNYPPSLLFVICIVFLLFINFRNSKKIAEQQEKIIELAQQLSLIKYDVKKTEKSSKINYKKIEK